MIDQFAVATGLPFDDIRALVRRMPGPDAVAPVAARQREAVLTKPAGSLGRMEELAAWVATWQGKHPPTVQRPMMAIFASNHGVAQKGVSAYPAEVTRQMLENFAAGGAAINQLCTAYDIGLKVFDLAIDLPSPDISERAAFEEDECAATMAFGMEAIAGGTDLLGIGEMGIGNTTVAAAVCHGLYGGAAEDWVGRGTGVDDAGYARKLATVRQAVALNAGGLDDPLEVLRRLGGREIAAMAGAILAARLERVPVVLDGYVVCAAAAVLHALDATALDHCVAGHVSAEAPHRRLLEKLGKAPLVDMGMRLGEGSGAALAMGIIKAAVACHNGMATFEQAKVATAVSPRA